MPIYEFECEDGHKVEKIFSMTECPNKIPCEECATFSGSMEFMEKIWSLPVVRFDAPPTIIFVNPRTGEREVAVSSTQRPPKGYVRHELRGPIERSKFEKEETLRKHVEDELLSEKLKQGREQTAKNIHDDINARMNAVTNKVYNPDTRQEENVEWDAVTKAMLKKSMAHTRKKHEKIKPKRTNVRLDVNHLDNSNLIK